MQNSLLKEIQNVIQIALAEDCALSDVTSDLTIPTTNSVKFVIKSRENMVFCGKKVIEETIKQLKNSKKFRNSSLKLKILAKDGDFLAKNSIIAHGEGNSRLIFAAERVILNLIQHLSGISTTTHNFVKKLNNDKIKILDTRKTIPGLRYLQKYAVKIGDGQNHRFNLSDMVLIKDNHIAAAGSIKNAIKLAKTSKLKVEIECDTINQVKEAITESPNVIMLDNMTNSQIEESSQIIRQKSSKIKIEVSGGINIDNISELSKLDIDFISIGGLTHNVKAIDIGLDIIEN